MSAAAPVDHAVFCIGVSHHGAPLELLERLTVPTEALAGSLEPFTARDDDGKRFCEGVILSTCNRTEIYAARRTPIAPDGECPRFAGLPEGIVKLLSERSGRTPHELSNLLFRHDGWAAVEHLFRVVCGLDSLVVGESQIVGQVARAYAAAQIRGTAGVVLSTLFQEALRGGRKARARIGIGRNAANVGSLAVARAGELAGPVSEARVVVIGTGEIGRIVLHSLQAAKARQVEIVSRSLDRAEAAAERAGFHAFPLSRLPALVGGCDVLISTTRASTPLVSAELVRDAMTRRAGRRLVLIDLAVPRTIDPAASAVEGVVLLDIDSFKEQRALTPLSPESVRVEAMLVEELAVMKLRMTELSLRPVIGDLWRKAEAIRGEVLQRARARLPHLDEQSWMHVEELAASLVARLLHDPATRLRAEAGNGHAAAYAEALAYLFGRAE